jgi:hypothetical protein
MVVPVPFSDLEKLAPRHLTTQTVELLQHAEHHLGPAFPGALFSAEIDPCASRFVGGGSQQSLDPLEPALDVEQLDLPNLVSCAHLARIEPRRA